VGGVLDGRYRIESLLGEGGMGAVYSATDLRLEKRVAVKVMARELAANPEAMARFHREARVTSGLGHPHIVQVFDSSTTPTGEPFLVMEFLEGEDLEHRLRRLGRLPAADVVRMVKQVASALAATHAKSIVHRDLKPANIYLLELAGETHFVKVLAFGISKVRDATTKLTKASMLLGTPFYMSTEQALGRVEDIDERTDQWALACIAWECLCGRSPFHGENIPSLLFQVVHETPAALTPKVAGLPQEVEEVLRCALAKNKQQRFATVTAFASALEGAITGASATQVRGKSVPVPRAEVAPGQGSRPEMGRSTTVTQTAGEMGDSFGIRRATKRRLWTVVGGTVAALSLAAFLLIRPGPGIKPQVTVPVPAAPAPPPPAPVPAIVPAPPLPAPSAAELARPAPATTASEPPRRSATASKRKRIKSETAARPIPASSARPEPTRVEPAPVRVEPAPVRVEPASVQPVRKGERRMIKEL